MVKFFDLAAAQQHTEVLLRIHASNVFETQSAEGKRYK